ncbi:MICOS complex subunit MIC27 isoform X1 [Ictalurus punctatus]|uniref:MICOS complex subunit n=1 Tax=Ictalurus punctatus TaxID=7998 RepID=A0A979EZ37_ICTPU|nr:MICOS complex subunit MIC27 isoform X1 [Ictalurus punctatus]XP_047013001.2 MICOS complex subunit MIC27 isoform X1 [Ictalurus punctatus]XP_053538132.1 MICOS complex subunit MIC27 isoform X1 [Ictalurus punctatus]XP_053538133.1 MICOS complex subunit MIC27 isoform X1 [Ictalurus punctatus]
MMAKVVKVVAVPVVLGFASLRITHSMSEDKPEVPLSPQQLSIYLTLPQERLRYSEEQPGLLQSSLSKFRWSLQSYVQKMKSACVSVKVTAVNLYYGGADVYHFLKDPPPGVVPRISVIAVSGLAGMILARKGSYLKRLGLPLSLASAGFALCYPVQTIAMLKVSGKKMHAASQWTTSTVASLRKQDTLPAVPVEEKLSSASSLTAESQPEMPCLQLSGVLQTPTAVPETQECEADLDVMDFGQSYPEDADLYSTRS